MKDFIITSLQTWDIEIGSTIKNTALEISKQNRVLYINTPMGKYNPDWAIVLVLPGSKNTVKMGIGVQQNREQEYSKNGNKNTVISINIINQGLHCIINKKQDCDGLKNKITYHYVSRDSQAS